MGAQASGPPLPITKIYLTLRSENLKCVPYTVNPDHPLESLDLSFNQITSLPSSLINLRSLDISANNLMSISSKIEKSILSYPNITDLRIAYNQLKQIPKSFANLKSLKCLIASHNYISSFPLILQQISVLDLTSNQLKSFPSIIPETLKTLNLSFNYLTEVQFSSPHLHQLNLSGNDIKSLSNCKFDALQSLDLSYNQLTSYDMNITPSIQFLHLEFNQLQTIESAIPNTLYTLVLSNNELKELPDLQDSFLKDFSVDNNSLTSFPLLPITIETLKIEKNQISQAESITTGNILSLSLSNNKLESIPNHSNSGIATVELVFNKLKIIDYSCFSQSLSHLDLSRNNIESVPAELFSLSQLQVLILTENQITTLPNEISHSMLQALSVANNPISELPPLPVTLLNFCGSFCKFTQFPESLADLPNLIICALSNNQIKEIPPMAKLESLYLAMNQIKELPPLPPSSLSILDVSHNNIKSVIFSDGFDELKELNLSHNPITELQLAQFPKLETLKLNGIKLESELFLNANDFPNVLSVDLVETLHIKFDQQFHGREILISDPSIISDEINSFVVKSIQSSRAGYSEIQGVRPTMEDSIVIRENLFDGVDLFAVFDGHAGSSTSCYASYTLPSLLQEKKSFSSHALISSLREMNESLRGTQLQDGSACVVAMRKGSHVICANIGDSRALIAGRECIALTDDHKPYNRSEMERIRAEGGEVREGRVMGILAVSRSIGDFSINGVSAIPVITEYEIKEDDAKIVLCCDGVFDVMSNEEVASVAMTEDDPSRAAAKILDMAFVRMTLDNVSVIVANL